MNAVIKVQTVTLHSFDLTLVQREENIFAAIMDVTPNLIQMSFISNFKITAVTAFKYVNTHLCCSLNWSCPIMQTTNEANYAVGYYRQTMYLEPALSVTFHTFDPSWYMHVLFWTPI